MNKNMKPVLFTVLGVLLCAAGILTVKRFDLGGQAAPYVCIGIGCGVFGQGLGEILSRRNEKNNPEAARQREVEENDERNIAIRDRA